MRVRFNATLDDNIGAEGLEALSPALKHLTQLKELYLQCKYYNICKRGFWQCMRITFVRSGEAYGARAPIARVCYTMITDNGIGAEGAKALSPALKHLTQLTLLGLARECCNWYERRGW